MNVSRTLLGILFILILNALIYWRASAVHEPALEMFAECARNSGRTSAAINLIMLLFLGRFGLKDVFGDANKKSWFFWLASLFCVNHLLHFVFVSQNFNLHHEALIWTDHIHGVILYLGLVALPFAIYFFKKMNPILYVLILAHLLNVTYMISITFWGRYKPVDPAYMHRIGVGVMILAVLYLLYRSLVDWRSGKA